MRRYPVPRGKLLQCGAELVKPYAKDPANVIVNVAARRGTAERRDGSSVIRTLPNGVIIKSPPALVFWLPMTEAARVEASTRYMKRFGAELVAHLDGGGTVVVHCQEGLFRSVTFAEQLQALAVDAVPAPPEGHSLPDTPGDQKTTQATPPADADNEVECPVCWGDFVVAETFAGSCGPWGSMEGPTPPSWRGCKNASRPTHLQATALATTAGVSTSIQSPLGTHATFATSPARRQHRPQACPPVWRRAARYRCPASASNDSPGMSSRTASQSIAMVPLCSARQSCC